MIKHIKKILPILLIIGFTNCSTSQKAMKLQEKTPFTIEGVFIQEWTSAHGKGSSGLSVQMTIKNLNKKTVQLKEFFVAERKTTIEDNSTNNNGLHVAHFTNPETKETILHNDHEKEAGNEPPKLQEKIPFTLANDEAVISYTENGTLNYHKIKGIIYKFPIFYQGTPGNKQ